MIFLLVYIYVYIYPFFFSFLFFSYLFFIPQTGPPEHTRDHVIAGALAMKNGDWVTCEKHILTLSIWALFPNADSVRIMLRQRIKEESLRTYLFAFSGFYDSLSLISLS